MKKHISVLLAILLLLTDVPTDLAETASVAEGTTSDTLIVYFTRVGISDFEPDVDVVSSAS